MLPKVFNIWHLNTHRPLSRFEINIQEYFKKMTTQGISQSFLDNQIITEKEAINALLLMNISETTSFYQFYKIFKSTCDELYELDQILENYQSQNWIALLPENIRQVIKEKYPNAGERYLQITSIEGGGSYFYDKETDYVYDVNWGQEQAMITGELKPWFTSFYDFLEWYYGEDDEE